MPSWLLTSLILSVGLTVVLNALPRLFPGARTRMEHKLTQQMQPPDPDGRRVRVLPVEAHAPRVHSADRASEPIQVAITSGSLFALKN